MANSNATDRIFVVGGTGNSGKQLVRDLIKADIPTTLYTRDPTNASSLFQDAKQLNTVKGDLSDLTPLKEAIKGHTRLFMVIPYSANMSRVKPAIAEIAYNAGVKQIVDVSGTANFAPGWRQSFLGVALWMRKSHLGYSQPRWNVRLLATDVLHVRSFTPGNCHDQVIQQDFRSLSRRHG